MDNEQTSLFRKESVESIQSPEQLTDYIKVTNPGIWIILFAIIILLAYTYLQGVRRKLRYQLPGTLFTTLLWLGFSYLFELFIKRFWQASSLYGSLASVFLAAMWLKTIVMILFYGAALNEALIHRAAEKRADN